MIDVFGSRNQLLQLENLHQPWSVVTLSPYIEDGFIILIRGRKVCNPTISIQSYLAACRFDYLDVRLERIMVILTTHKESLELNVSSMERPLSH